MNSKDLSRGRESALGLQRFAPTLVVGYRVLNELLDMVFLPNEPILETNQTTQRGSWDQTKPKP